MNANRRHVALFLSLTGLALISVGRPDRIAAQTVAKEPSHPAPARTHGWSWTPRSNSMNPESGRRDHVFYVGEPVVFQMGGSAVSYEVRDYWGHLIDQGPSADKTTINVKLPGWYKLYVYGKDATREWGDVVGGAMFVIFRKDARFPDMPPKDAPGGSEVARGVTGMGPQRHAADAAKPEEAIKNLEAAVAADRLLYLPYDPVRKRVLMLAFPGGTKDRLDGVKKIAEHFKNDITYYEPRNEPNYGASGAGFVANEMKDFYAAIKAVSPDLKVMGPGTVAINPDANGLGFIEAFLKAGGANYIDAFSFHIYNGINGDLWLGRKSMSTLTAMLKKYGADQKELWQTEQGFMAALYGAYLPRLQGRWTMLEMMLFEQYGLPKEHNHLWYDTSHGFWDFPTWWENDGGNLNPVVVMMRVYSEEVFGTTFKKAYDFGELGNKFYVGSLFEGPEKSVAVFLNAGLSVGQLDLKIKGGDDLHVVSAFGEETTIPVKGGVAKLPVSEIPVWVALAKGQTLEVVPLDPGQNLALLPGVSVTAGLEHQPFVGGTAANLTKLNNGKLENWYWNFQSDSGPWTSDTTSFPVWVEIHLPEPMEVAHVVVYAAPPWQMQGTLLDYELQANKKGKWVTLDHVQENPHTFGVFTPATRTTVDSFASDHWIFPHSFQPVTTDKLRLLVHDATWGGSATKIVTEAGGASGMHQVVLREIEVYGSSPDVAVRASMLSAERTAAFTQDVLTVTITNQTSTKMKIKARVTVPEGWRAEPASLAFSAGAGKAAATNVSLIPPADIPVGSVPVLTTLVDARDRVLDRHVLTLTLEPPVAVTPQLPPALDEKEQPLLLRIRNLTEQPITGKVRLTLSGASAVEPVENSFGPLAPLASTVVTSKVNQIKLSGALWKASYTVTVNHLTIAASQSLSIRPWMIVGPFSNDFDKVFGPEIDVDLAATYPALSDRKVGWSLALNNPDGFVDLAGYLNPHDHVSAYGVVFVKSPSARKVIFSAGSADGIKAWLNGNVVVSHNVVTRGAVPGQEKVSVDLKAGWNEVLLKITQSGGAWGFYFDLLGDDGQPLKDLLYAQKKGE